MPRRREVPKRVILPDPKFKDVVVTKFINMIMSDGKRGKAERIFYGALELIEQKKKTEPLEIFKKALANVKPEVEVKSRRVGGATYQVPMEIRASRAVALSMRWLVGYSRKRNGKSMIEKLAAEFIDASEGKGGSIKKKDDTHKMAEANKAFAHFRW